MENMPNGNEIVIPDRVDLTQPASTSPIHAKKIREYYNGGKTMLEVFEEEGGSAEVLINFLMKEFCREIDNLSGDCALSRAENDNKTATIISSKRAEIIERYSKLIMDKKQFEASTSIDVESPSMKIIFQYFLEKCQESFSRSGMAEEISNTFFRSFNDVCGNTWKKDLKKRIAEIKTQ